MGRWGVVALCLVAFTVGCDGGASQPTDDSCTNPAVVHGEGVDLNGPAAPGTFTKCTYTPPTNSGYSAAQVIYPCEKAKGPFAATTLTGGWTNNYGHMSWLSDHLVTHGYVVYAMTPNNPMGMNPEWVTAHTAGIQMLKSENARAGAAIKGLVKTDRLQIMGFSKGGGGSLLASAKLGSAVKTTQALAPYLDSLTMYRRMPDLSGIKGAVACYTGSADEVAPPADVEEMYNTGLPETSPRLFAKFAGMEHMDWATEYVWPGSAPYCGNPTYQDRAKTYVTAFMKTYLEGLTGYESYLSGQQKGWFTSFARNSDSY